MALITNLQAYYKMESNSNDSTANANNGTDSNISYTTGKILQAASFNGTSSKIDTGTTNLPSSGGDRTINAWIKTNSVTGTHAIFCYGTATTGNGFQLNLNGAKLQVGKFGGNATDSNTSLSTATWYMVTVTFSGSTVTYYLNGSSDGSQTLSSVSTTIGTARIGKSIINWDSADGTYVWDGLIDELGVWDRALSGAEITSLYGGGAGFTYPFATNTGAAFLLNFI